jgi:hypothetical protein
MTLENKSCSWTFFLDKYKSSEIIESSRDAQKFFPSSVAKNRFGCKNNFTAF